MNLFYMYLQLGLEHISDLKGYDHILFITVLTSVYLIKQWRKLLVLVTAFTIGHSITLALATLKVIWVDSAWIEFLIPVTIFITGIANVKNRKEDISATYHYFKYMVALFFGLIHGLGFSFYLQNLLGKEASIWKPLLAFNLGIELGQLLIVVFVLIISRILVFFVHINFREWVLIISGAGMGVSLIMALERIPF